MKRVKVKVVIGVVGWLVAGLVLSWLISNPPKLKYTYLPQQLSTQLENGEVRGFFPPETDAAGNRYSWTREQASLLLNLETTKPFKLTFNIRSAAIAGGPSAPVEILINSTRVGQLDPPLKGLDFQPLSLKLSTSRFKGPLDVTLVAAPYQPPNGDRRVLGTMIKSIELDESEAWDSLGKRVWLWGIVAGLGLVAVTCWLLLWRGRRSDGTRTSASWAYPVAVSALSAGAGLVLIIFGLYLQTGILDRRVHPGWLWGLLYLMVVFGLTALMLTPVRADQRSILGHLKDWLERKNTFWLLWLGLGEVTRSIFHKLKAGRQAFLLLIVYGILALGLLAPIASSDRVLPNIPDVQAHMGLIVQAKLALDEGQFPLRTGPWQYDGWGYPTYQYYGQLPHTLGALIYKYLTPDNPYLAFLIIAWIFMVVGAFYTYRISLWLTHSRIAAALAGMLYIASPYFLINLHARAALAEVVGQGLVPFALYYALRAYVRPSATAVLLSSLGWFLLLAAHTITFVFASVFVAILLVIEAATRLHRLKTWFRLLRVGLGYLLAWLLGMYYLGPLILQQDGLYIQQALPDPYKLNWLTPISGLLSPTSVPPYPGFTGTIGLNSAAGWPMLAAWAVVLYYYFLGGRVRRWPLSLRRTSRYIPGLLILFVLAFFMTWSPLDFWPSLPKQLQIPQFPYRMLAQVAWVGALLVPYTLVLLVRKLEFVHLGAGVLLIGLFASPYLPAAKPDPLTVAQIVKAPDVGYGKLTYLYEPKITELYANEELFLYGFDQILVPNKAYTLPSWSAGAKPVLHLQGATSLKTIQPDAHLALLINGAEIGQTPLKAGPLKWDLPLEKAILLDKTFKAMFVTDPPDAAQITVSSLNLSDLPPEQTLIGLGQTQAAFQRQGAQTVGQVTIEDKFPRMVQLPVLYYPNLLEVRLDGRKVDYTGLPNRYFTMVGLKLEPGTHQISVEFVGLQWANLISLVAWASVLLGLLGCLVLTIYKLGRAKNRAEIVTYPEKELYGPPKNL